MSVNPLTYPRLWSCLVLGTIVATIGQGSLLAQTPPPATIPLPKPLPPERPTQPSPPLLPPPENLYQLPTTPQPPVPQVPLNIPGTIIVSRFEIVGSTIFSAETLAQTTAPFVGRSLTFPELLQAASAITKLYTDRGYITSGAFVPADQTFRREGGVVRIQVLEGRLEEIQVSGTRRLNQGYIQSRLAVAGAAPLNVDRLLNALQLLQLNPLISTISTELATGSKPGQSLLRVAVTEAKTFSPLLSFDNNRSPSVGSEQRQIGLSDINLLGLGDTLRFNYTNTDGSDSVETSYTLPVSPHNTTVRFAYRTASNRVIEAPFNALDITAASRSYELSVRQPIAETPNQDFAVGLTFSRQESETALLGIPFALSSGANSRGETRISALRFFQEGLLRGSQEVIAARSQFSLGLDALGSTVNPSSPDSRFLSWRGQAQYARLLAPDTLVLARTGIQLADRPLVPLEQLSLGGVDTVRGYRQDYLLSDNGAFGSLEVRIPVLRVPEVEGILQVTPFLDFGTTWNTGRATPDPSTLFAGGFGLLWRQGNYLTAQLQWGIPFISVSENRRTWQENGLYFSIVYTPLLF
ncbi:MAG: ShlB/FhaC/HecB family hemolysin secretion/activation protein [Leptolyngbyaceae cyanobacterium bins.59]|nr:ShlB/FhaC/HecB family hemolysin secretion/activation protein [Leptolyngbyaceae cyanobacterium bins.59]